MAYVAPNTWATNDLITAAKLNQDLRDNPSFLATPPSCRVYNSANISHATSGVAQALTFNSERFDTDTMHSTSSLTNEIVFKTAGKYIVGANVIWAASTGGTYRQIWIRLNGTTAIASVKPIHTIGNAAYEQFIETYYAFAVNDYVELMANQDSGGALNITAAGNYSPEFWAVWQSL